MQIALNEYAVHSNMPMFNALYMLAAWAHLSELELCIMLCMAGFSAPAARFVSLSYILPRPKYGHSGRQFPAATLGPGEVLYSWSSNLFPGSFILTCWPESPWFYYIQVTDAIIIETDTDALADEGRVIKSRTRWKIVSGLKNQQRY